MPYVSQKWHVLCEFASLQPPFAPSKVKSNSIPYKHTGNRIRSRSFPCKAEKLEKQEDIDILRFHICSMNQYIKKERVEYIRETRCTSRQTAYCKMVGRPVYFKKVIHQSFNYSDFWGCGWSNRNCLPAFWRRPKQLRLSINFDSGYCNCHILHSLFLFVQMHFQSYLSPNPYVCRLR